MVELFIVGGLVIYILFVIFALGILKASSEADDWIDGQRRMQ